MTTMTNNTIQSDLQDYVLHLADTNLILGQRLCEWCGHGPVLEQDIALSNIGLDILGATRSLYQYAAELQGGEATEDYLAFFRTEREFKNLLLVEQANGDFGYTVMRQFLFETFQMLFLQKLSESKDQRLAAIAEKSLIETKYHYKWSAEWVIRLGDGTEESKQRIQQSLHDIWTYSGEMFLKAGYEQSLIDAGIIPDVSSLQTIWEQKVAAVLQEATLEMPATDAWMQKGGKTGVHTEYLGYILAEMQHIPRQYPGQTW